MTASAATNRPVPSIAVVLPCATLVALALAMTLSSLALAADGPYYLVRIVETDAVFSTDARLIGNALRQIPVLLALEMGVTDTHHLSIALGVGQIMLPAALWSAAIVLARSELVAFSAVVLTAGLCAGMTWFCNVGEFVLAMPLIVLVAVLLWRAERWSWLHLVLAVVASATLIATYELVVLVSPLLAVWAGWRAVVSRDIPSRYGAALVATGSMLSIVAALAGVGSRRHQSHTLSLVYSVVSLEPWQFYVSIAACALVVWSFAFALGRLRLAIAGVAIVGIGVAVATFTPDPPDAFRARGGTGIAVLALTAFLFVLWARRTRPAAGTRAEPRSTAQAAHSWLAMIPVLFVVAVAYVNISSIDRWNRSLEAFQTAVNETNGTSIVADVVPRGRSHVVWGWTSPSLSLIVRRHVGAGVLVDGNPSFVPFAAKDASEQLGDTYVWRS